MLQEVRVSLERVAEVLGENESITRAGKSTLVQILFGLRKPLVGQVRIGTDKAGRHPCDTLVYASSDFAQRVRHGHWRAFCAKLQGPRWPLL